MPQVAIAAPYQLVSARHGTMLVNSNDMYMGQAYLRYGESFETEIDVLFSLLQFPGLVIDVGANMGVHAVPVAKELARQGRKMLAFEPQPVIFQQLCANLALNGLMNVQAFPYACGSRTGTVSFAAPDYCRTGNFGSISMSREAVAASAMTAPCRTLDEIVQDTQVALIKIDVEGFEIEVLKGARKLIKRWHPAMYVENDRVEKSAALIQWLREQNYRLYWHIATLYNPNNFCKNTENIFGDIGSYNMLCLHRDCPLKIEGSPEITDASFHPLGTPKLQQTAAVA